MTDKEKRFIIYASSSLRRIVARIDANSTPVSSEFDIARGLANNKVDFGGRKYKALKSMNVRKYYIEGDLKSVNTSYANVFKGEMIIMPRTVLSLQSMLKEKNLICLDRIYYLTPLSDLSLKYVLGVLNSEITNTWFNYYYTTTKVSGNYFDLNGNQIGSIPIPSASPVQQQPIINLVDKILSSKKVNPQANTSIWEKEIDELVYKLYGLSEEEIRIVKGGL